MNELESSLDFNIVNVTAPIFGLLTPLQVAEKADVAPDDLREQIEKSFLMMERRCFELQVPPEDIKDIKYAMAAFSDEVVLNSRWEKKFDWMAKPLAIEYFGDSAIGQNFFVRLDELRNQIDEKFELVQLYFSVLVLGFQGKYRLSGYEQLQAFISALRTDIEKRAGHVNRVLADNAAPENKIKSRIAGQQSYWVMAVLFLACVTVMNVFYSNKVQAAVADSAKAIEVMAGSDYLKNSAEISNK